MKLIYLDYAATTPLDPEVSKSMNGIAGDFGNPGSLHSFGQKAKTLLDWSRQNLAKTIAANHREIIFASSATEANNLILRGVLKSFFKNQKNCRIIPKIITSSTEHPSVLETVKVLESEGAIEAVYLPVNPNGIVDLTALEKSLDEKTILVSVMWVNNETGALQPIEKISTLVKIFKKENEGKLISSYPLLHTDAVQAFNLFDLNVIRSGVELMTLSSHKMYGPKGAACAYIKEEAKDMITPIITGGGQEYGLRSGTENVSAIFGFSKAAEIVQASRKKEFLRLEKISKIFLEKIKTAIPGVEINGSWANRSPQILNLWFPRHKNIGIALDMAGIAASSGSACSQRYEKPSYVLKQTGFDDDRVKESIRFSFGRFTDEKEIDEAASRIIMALKNN